MTAPPAWLAAAKARVEAQEKQDQDRKAARAKKRAAERAKKETTPAAISHLDLTLHVLKPRVVGC